MKTKREQSGTVTRDQARLARDVLRDPARPFQDRRAEADRLLSEVLDAAPKSFASEVRKALSTDRQRVKAFLGGLQPLEFGGRAQDRGFEQLQAWRHLQAANASELPRDFALPDVGAAWHDLVHDVDSRFKAVSTRPRPHSARRATRLVGPGAVDQLTEANGGSAARAAGGSCRASSRSPSSSRRSTQSGAVPSGSYARFSCPLAAAS